MSLNDELFDKVTRVLSNGARPHIKAGIVKRLRGLCQALETYGAAAIDVNAWQDRLEAEIERLEQMP